MKIRHAWSHVKIVNWKKQILERIIQTSRFKIKDKKDRPWLFCIHFLFNSFLQKSEYILKMAFNIKFNM